VALLGALALLLAGCGGGGATSNVPANQSPPPSGSHQPSHVIVVIQENRSVDNLFHVLPGVDTVSYGLNSQNQHVPLTATSLQSPYDPHHTHLAFVTEYNNGLMNGFDKEGASCSGPPGCSSFVNVYTYVQASDIQNYLTLAEQFVFADHVMQTNQGPSYPAHFYLVAAQSGNPLAAAENASNLQGGCDAPPKTTLSFVDLRNPFPGLPETQQDGACVDFPTIFDELDAAKVSWKYYAPYQDSLWNAPNGISHLYHSPEFSTKVVYPEATILSDITNGKLPNVSYVVPFKGYSDHPQLAGVEGPNWVATVTNAVAASKYWKDTVIFVVWDDWGGWYDHYAPQAPSFHADDPYEYGMRVPLIVISPYVRQRGLIDHTRRDFTSILRFIESNFGLHTLTSVDAATDDMMSLFNFNAATPLGYGQLNTHGFVPYGRGAVPKEFGRR
jgi:phospholipase C